MVFPPWALYSMYFDALIMELYLHDFSSSLPNGLPFLETAGGVDPCKSGQPWFLLASRLTLNSGWSRLAWIDFALRFRGNCTSLAPTSRALI